MRPDVSPLMGVSIMADPSAINVIKVPPHLLKVLMDALDYLIFQEVTGGEGGGQSQYAHPLYPKSDKVQSESRPFNSLFGAVR